MKVKSQKSKVKNYRGFTLVELIVAMGIFTMAVSIAIGSLVGLFDANSKSQSLASVMNNLNFSMENMTRNIRFATTYHCGENEDGGSPPTDILINSGDGNYGPDAQGKNWLSDAFYSPSPGNTATIPAPINGTTDDSLYQTVRYAEPTYTFSGLIQSSDYTVTLKFAEHWANFPGARFFDVKINGIIPPGMDDFDIFVAAGGINTALDRTFDVTSDSSGRIIIEFIMGNTNALVSAIEISAPGSGDGTGLTAPESCNDGDVFLAVSTSSMPVIYKFENNKLRTSSDNGLSYSNVTSDEVTIEHGRFYVFNTLPGDDNQPYVLMIMRGFAGKKASTESRFDIQTVISQRELDI